MPGIDRMRPLGRLGAALVGMLLNEVGLAQRDPTLIDRFEGYKQLRMQVFDSTGAEQSVAQGHALFVPGPNTSSVRETFTIYLPDDTVTGDTYIGRSFTHDRYEVIQSDSRSRSMLLLHGPLAMQQADHWVLDLPTGFPQWGLPDGSAMRWEYTFFNQDSLRKDLLLGKDSQHLRLASRYTYWVPSPVIHKDGARYTLPVPGGVIAYRTVGSGETVMLLNGGPGWSSAHIEPLADSIAQKGYRVITFDQRGTGRSVVAPLDSTMITLDHMLDDIRLLQGALDVPRITLVGHSFGGMLAMAYASKHPGHLKRLVLLAPGGTDLGFLDPYQAALNVRLGLQEQERIARWSAKAAIAPGRAGYNIIHATLPAFLTHDEQVPDVMRFINSGTWDLGTAALVWADLARTAYDVAPGLPHLNVPVSLIQGTDDAVGPAVPLWLQKHVDHSEVTMLPDCSHILWIDAPDRFYPSLFDALSR